VTRSDADGVQLMAVQLMARCLIGFSRRHIDLQLIASCLCCS